MRDLQEHEAANERKWSRKAATFDHWRFNHFRYMQRELIASAALSAPCDFLDLGCGTGWAVRHAAETLRGQGHFVGVDLSQGMIEKARRSGAGMPNVQFRQGSAEQLPLENSSFDVVICTNSFHHYLHPDAAIKEIARVLRVGGSVHILDMAADDFFMRWIDRRVGAHEKEHVHFYSTSRFATMFSEAGMRLVKSRLFKFMYPVKVRTAVKEGLWGRQNPS
jgi:ubiquinone/menaquinone biosynthesis C-methylase UbiE